MTTSTFERTVLPPAEPLDALVAMLGREGAEPATTLVGPNGERLVLPPEVFEVLRDVVDAMAQGQAVTIAPVHQRLTTQEAADTAVFLLSDRSSGINCQTIVVDGGMAVNYFDQEIIAGTVGS